MWLGVDVPAGPPSIADKSVQRRFELGQGLIAAAKEGHRYTVLLLARKGADLKARDREGKTALVRAVINCDLEMVKLLLRLGSDVDARGLNGFTPLHYAIMRGDEGVFRYLLKAGADVQLHSYTGKDCWSLAKLWKRREFTGVLDRVAATSRETGAAVQECGFAR